MELLRPHPTITNDSRYLTADEKAALSRFAASAPARVRAAEAIERAEPEVFGGVLDALRRRHPEWDDTRAWPAGLGAERAAVRYAVHALLFDDPPVFSEKGLDWARTVQHTAGVAPGLGRDVFGLIRDGFRKALPAEAFALIDPYLSHAAAAAPPA
jgi:hypothetical protein